MNNPVLGVEVQTTNRKEVPPTNETIADDLDLDAVVKIVNAINVYFRDKESCPYNRGNWVVDFFEGHNRIIPIFCLKLPAEMKEEDVNRWVKPLQDKLKNKNN